MGKGDYIQPGSSPACCDKCGRQLINWVGINAYVGSVNPLDIRRCEYVEWHALSVYFPSV